MTEDLAPSLQVNVLAAGFLTNSTPSFFTLSCLNPLVVGLLTGLSPRQKKPGFFENRGFFREILTQKPGFWPRVRKSC